MVGETKPESIETRFGAYIDELHELFRSRDVRFGTPADVAPFAEQVSQPGAFQDEMGSMVRSMVYRENERMGRGELLELLATAVGGPKIDGSAQELQGAVRRLFIFLNEALRKNRNLFQEEPAEDEPVTAGDVLAAAGEGADARPEPTPSASARRESANAAPVQPVPRVANVQPPVAHPSAAAAPRPAASPEVPERAAGNEVLFRAMSLAAEEEPTAAPVARAQRQEIGRIHRREDTETMRQRWIVPVIAAGLAVIGGGVYLTRPVPLHNLSQRVANSVEPAAPASPVVSCVAPMASDVTRTGLQERAHWAHNLLDQKLSDAALPEIREIARLDPGYPGIKLDESYALLNLKRPDDAREAVDSQIGVSECLAKLPPAMLEAYCTAQFGPSTMGVCKPQLAQIRQAAELQAALVHLELGHRVAADDSSSAAMEEMNRASGALLKGHQDRHVAEASRSRRATPLPPATEDDAEVPFVQKPVPAARSAGRKNSGDDTLVRGEGTDSAYGAYQKPE